MLTKGRRCLPSGKARPLHPLKRLRNIRAGIRRSIQTHRHDERPIARHQVGALVRKAPFEPKVAFLPRLRVGGDEGDEQRAVADFAPDFLIPGIPAPQLALVEPHFDAAGAQPIAKPFAASASWDA